MYFARKESQVRWTMLTSLHLRGLARMPFALTDTSAITRLINEGYDVWRNGIYFDIEGSPYTPSEVLAFVKSTAKEWKEDGTVMFIPPTAKELNRVNAALRWLIKHGFTISPGHDAEQINI